MSIGSSVMELEVWIRRTELAGYTVCSCVVRLVDLGICPLLEMVKLLAIVETDHQSLNRLVLHEQRLLTNLSIDSRESVRSKTPLALSRERVVVYGIASFGRYP